MEIPESHKILFVVLQDEREIECKPLYLQDSGESDRNVSNYYIRIDTISNLIAGRGEMFDKNTNLSSKFCGIIQGNRIDSSKNVTDDSKEYAIYWTKDNLRLLFEKKDFIEVSAEQGIGLFIIYADCLKEIIRFDEIKDLQQRKISWYGTASLIAICLGVVIALSFVKFPDFSGLQ